MKNVEKTISLLKQLKSLAIEADNGFSETEDVKKLEREHFNSILAGLCDELDGK